jgi:hypothetical protein
MSKQDKTVIGEGGKGGKATVRGNDSFARGGDGGKGVVGPGGLGGDANIEGDRSLAVGGRGGRGGLGPGGPGGKAETRGDDAVSIGGEGGEANQVDGRGGRGGRSGYLLSERPDFQLPDGRWISEFGRGGDGGHSPQYAARLMVIGDLLGHSVSMYATSAGVRDAETAKSLLNRLNGLLSREGRGWRVQITDGCFEFFEP